VGTLCSILPKSKHKFGLQLFILITMRGKIKYLLIFFLVFSLTACSKQNRMSRSSFQKILKTAPVEVKGNVIFENEFVKIYFQKGELINLLKKERHAKEMNSCNRKRREYYIDMLQTRDDQIMIFKELSESINPENYFEIEFQRYFIELFTLKSPIAIFNKSTNSYEKEFMFIQRAGHWGCCFAEFTFMDNEKFLETRFARDFLIVEECE
jgi:hypothetical protein